MNLDDLGSIERAGIDPAWIDKEGVGRHCSHSRFQMETPADLNATNTVSVRLYQHAYLIHCTYVRSTGDSDMDVSVRLQCNCHRLDLRTPQDSAWERDQGDLIQNNGRILNKDSVRQFGLLR